MKTETLLNSMVRDLWLDLQDPAIVWQLGTLAACLLVAWIVERRVLRWWHASQPTLQIRGSDAALQAIGRILWPAFAMLLVAAVRPVLAVWHKTNALRLAVVLLLAYALIQTIVFMVSKLVRTRAIAAFERVLVALVWAGVALYVTGYGVDVVEFLDALVFPIGKQRVSLWTILSGGFWVMLTLLVALWVGRVLETRLLAIDSGDLAVRTVLGRILRAALILVAVLVGLSLVGLDITALSVFGGALGVGLGLGLQRIASSFISGFVVLLERRVRIGDLITVDKYTGRVSEINTRFTIVRSGDGWEAIVPNELLMINPVQNHSLHARMRLRSSVLVGFDTDVARVSALLVEAAAAHPRVLQTPAPTAMLLSLGPDGLLIELGYSIGDPENGVQAVQSDVNRAVWASLKAHDVAVTAPTREARRIADAPFAADQSV